MPTTTGVATSFIDFTRASNATVTDSDGKVKWAPHNLLTNSESFDNAAWGKYLATVSANTQAAPNGTTTADTVTASAGNDVHRVQRASDVAIGASANASLSIFVKAGTHNFVTIGFYSATEVFVSATFNLASGSAATETDVGTTSGTVVSTEKVDVGTGWYRLTITGNYSGSSALSFVNFAQAATGNSYTNFGQPVANLVGTETFHLWGATCYRSDLGGMQPNTSAYPLYNPTTPKNLLGYTEDFSSWSTYNATPSGTTTAAPNGLTTADTLTGTIDTSQHLAYRQYTAFVNATAYKLSVFAKAGTNNFLYIGAQSFGGAIFDLANGVVGSNISGGIGSIQSIGNGWYRCIVSVTATGTSSQIDVGVAPSGTSSSGPATGTIYLWGAQLSDSASLDSYVPVYGAAVTSAAYYGPRRDFDGATLACKGLLVEEQRSNLQLNSNVFGTSTFAATVVAGAAASPSGLIDASSLACTSTSGRAILSTSVTSGIVYTFSVFIKAGTNTSAYIELAGTAGSGGAVVFNLSSGTVTSGTGGAIVPAPNGFYRCSVTSTATGTGASDMRIGTGDATSKTVFVYGAQLEANASFATSYIPVGSTSSGATRNADVASVSTQAFPYSSTEGTLVVAWQLAQLSGSPAAIHLTDVAESNRIRINAYLSGINRSTITAAGSLVDNIDTSSAATGITKYALGGKSADYAVYRNGSAGGTSTNAGFPSGCTEMRIGRDAATGNFNGHIRQITYLPRRISNTELQTRTS